MEPVVPEPILLNVWKHHLGYTLNEIRKSAETRSIQELAIQLNVIGNSTTDLYIGDLTPLEISDFVIQELETKKLIGEKEYKNWIGMNPEDYKEIKFTDTSVWILKIGIINNRHIHIHPGRNVPYTKRIKASLLKTGISSAYLSLVTGINIFDISLINEARQKICGLDPIKFVTMNQELGKVLELFGLKLDII